MIILVLLLSVNFSWARDFKYYRIGDLSVVFHRVDGLWVNKSCKDNKCQALANGRKELNRVVSTEMVGGKNPFAVRCKTVMKGNVLIGTDKAGNQQSLCHFSDDSYLK